MISYSRQVFISKLNIDMISDGLPENKDSMAYLLFVDYYNYVKSIYSVLPRVVIESKNTDT